MSDKTLQGIEDAIRAHFEDRLSDPSHPRHGMGDMVIDWVVGLTVSNIIEVNGKEIVGFGNIAYFPDANPNTHSGLAMWLAEEVSSIIPHQSNEDD